MAATQQIIEQFHERGRAPQHMGRMATADGIGNVGSIVVGRALRWFLSCSDGQITQVRFQVFACSEMVPSAAVLAELCEGTSLVDASTIDEAALCAAAGGLPRSALPVLSWPLMALRLAIADAGGPAYQLPADVEHEPLVCRCKGVTELAIVQAIADVSGIPTAADLTTMTAAGSGCGTCVRDIEQLIERETASKPPPLVSAGSSAGATGRVALMKQIMHAADDLLSEAAGSIELWDMRGAKVLVRTDPERADLQPLLDRLLHRIQDEVDPALMLELVAD